MPIIVTKIIMILTIKHLYYVYLCTTVYNLQIKPFNSTDLQYTSYILSKRSLVIVFFILRIINLKLKLHRRKINLNFQETAQGKVLVTRCHCLQFDSFEIAVQHSPLATGQYRVLLYTTCLQS